MIEVFKLNLTRDISVVTGLLLDRSRKLGFSKTAGNPRKCRQSLGVVCDQIYDEIRHRGATLYVDPTDGLTYATAVISWVAKQVNHTEIAWDIVADATGRCDGSKFCRARVLSLHRGGYRRKAAQNPDGYLQQPFR